MLYWYLQADQILHLLPCLLGNHQFPSRRRTVWIRHKFLWQRKLYLLNILFLSNKTKALINSKLFYDKMMIYRCKERNTHSYTRLTRRSRVSRETNRTLQQQIIRVQ